MFIGRSSTADRRQPVKDFRSICCGTFFTIYLRMKVKDCSHVAQTHITSVKTVDEFAENTNKTCLNTEQRFPTKACLLATKTAGVDM
jgi:hypothetical protein